MNAPRQKSIEVQKKSGQCQRFSKEKLKRSLNHTCLSPTVSKMITEEIAKHFTARGRVEQFD